MKDQNKELLDDFVSEVRTITKSVGTIVTTIQNKGRGTHEQFEEMGQMIDRIYGTVTTMGFFKFGEYTKIIKECCYMGSASENVKGQIKLVSLAEIYIGLTEDICKNIHKSEELKKVLFRMKIEKNRAELLANSKFRGVTKTSVVVED